ncbi:ribonucleotide reductase subunit 2, partial [Ephemerocybe angulata]
LWRMYLAARGALWMPTDLDLEKDKHDWAMSMSDSEKWIVARVLGYFATADGLVADNIVARFVREVDCTEAKYFYGLQVVVENIHAETCAMFIDALVPAGNQKTLLSWSTKVPSIAFKNLWAAKWIVDNSRTFAERLVAFVCVEGIFCCSCFAMIGWIKSNGKMPGLSLANDLIRRDEDTHIDFACALFRHIRSHPASSSIVETVQEAVDVETEFAIG